MDRIVIIEDGTKHYINDAEQFHRLDGPAVIKQNGVFQFWTNGHPSSNYILNIPDFELDGERLWYDGYSRHSIDRPSSDKPNGYKTWHCNWTQIWPELK